MLRIWLKIKWKLFQLFRLKPKEFIYWNQRSIAFGEKSVLNSKNALTLDETTEKQWALFKNELEQIKKSEVKKILDFGCGNGRFTHRLATYFDCSSLGVDSSEYLISLNKPSNQVKFELLSGFKLTIEDSSIDLLFICLVLGAVDGCNLKVVISELERVLRPGGQIMLIENTNANGSSGKWVIRTANDYKDLFKFASLTQKSTYLDCGEEISIFRGTKV